MVWHINKLFLIDKEYNTSKRLLDLLYINGNTCDIQQTVTHDVITIVAIDKGHCWSE